MQPGAGVVVVEVVVVVGGPGYAVVVVFPPQYGVGCPGFGAQ